MDDDLSSGTIPHLAEALRFHELLPSSSPRSASFMTCGQVFWNLTPFEAPLWIWISTRGCLGQHESLLA